MSLSRRTTLGLALAASTILAGPAFAQAKLKVAAIYTVPVEQQWVSRIDKALKAAVARGEIEYVFSENVANADYERVMREYAEAGHAADRRRGLRRRGRGAQGGQGLPQDRLPDGQQRQAAGAQLLASSTTTSRSRPT